MRTARDIRFEALLFDAGGVFVLPDPTVLGPLLAYYGGDPTVERHVRAHYAGMAAKSAARSGEAFWHEYDLAYVDSVGVPAHERDAAAASLGRHRNAWTWRWPIAENIAALRALHGAGVARGGGANPRGPIQELLRRGGVCQVGPGEHTPVLVIIDSHVVGVAKPDPAIFEHALHVFPGVDRRDVAYVGDSVTMDVGGARAAGLHPILLDPYDDHPGADFDRIRSLAELLPS